MKLEKGYKFVGPEGQGYRLTRDVSSGDVMLASDFEPYGGAPQPVFGGQLPDFLTERLRELQVGS